MKVGIVITDANILIDLIHLELFTSLFGSDLFEFKTTDLFLRNYMMNKRMFWKLSLKLKDFRLSNQKNLT